MSYKLLLADDSITIQKVVELTLSEEGFEVTAVGDGEAALELAKKLLPDIILADVFMPKMDGYELCGKIRQTPSLKDIPVILLAGTFENFDDALASRSGANDHITKPFESADLISMVTRLVEAKGAQYEEALVAEPMEEALVAEELPDTSGSVDDLWSVVNMGSDQQPLAAATEILSEDELWKRANLVSDADEQAAFQPEEEVMPWDSLPVEPLTEEAEAIIPDAGFPAADFLEAEAGIPEAEFPAAEFPAADFLEAEADMPGVEFPAAEFPADEFPVAEFAEEEFPAVEISEPAAEPTALLDMEDFGPVRGAVKDEIAGAARDALDQKVREAVEGISREMIERIVWEVVPGLAEELIAREIERLRAGK